MTRPEASLPYQKPLFAEAVRPTPRFLACALLVWVVTSCAFIGSRVYFDWLDGSSVAFRAVVPIAFVTSTLIVWPSWFATTCRRISVSTNGLRLGGFGSVTYPPEALMAAHVVRPAETHKKLPRFRRLRIIWGASFVILELNVGKPIAISTRRADELAAAINAVIS